MAVNPNPNTCRLWLVNLHVGWEYWNDTDDTFDECWMHLATLVRSFVNEAVHKAEVSTEWTHLWFSAQKTFPHFLTFLKESPLDVVSHLWIPQRILRLNTKGFTVKLKVQHRKLHSYRSRKRHWRSYRIIKYTKAIFTMSNSLIGYSKRSYTKSKNKVRVKTLYKQAKWM